MCIIRHTLFPTIDIYVYRRAWIRFGYKHKQLHTHTHICFRQWSKFDFIYTYIYIYIYTLENEASLILYRFLTLVIRGQTKMFIFQAFTVASCLVHSNSIFIFPTIYIYFFFFKENDIYSPYCTVSFGINFCQLISSQSLHIRILFSKPSPSLSLFSLSLSLSLSLSIYLSLLS